jgi:hypothetical protein
MQFPKKSPSSSQSYIHEFSFVFAHVFPAIPSSVYVFSVPLFTSIFKIQPGGGGGL